MGGFVVVCFTIDVPTQSVIGERASGEQDVGMEAYGVFAATYGVGDIHISLLVGCHSNHDMFVDDGVVLVVGL